MKKGFTLIELITIIVLLGLLSILLVPNINKIINSSEEKGYNIQIKTIKDAAENFIIDYSEIIPSNLNSFTIELKLLKDLAFVDYNIKNPITQKYFSDDTLITLTKKINIFEATVYPTDSSTISEVTKYAKNIILLKEANLYIGDNFNSENNVMVTNLDGKIYTNCSNLITTNCIESISITNSDSLINDTYKTVIYNIKVTNDSDITYMIKREEKAN